MSPTYLSDPPHSYLLHGSHSWVHATRMVLPRPPTMSWKTGFSHCKIRGYHASIRPLALTLAHLPSFVSPTTSLAFISFWFYLDLLHQSVSLVRRGTGGNASGISFKLGTVPLSELLTDTPNGWMTNVSRIPSSCDATYRIHRLRRHGDKALTLEHTF